MIIKTGLNRIENVKELDLPTTFSSSEPISPEIVSQISGSGERKSRLAKEKSRRERESIDCSSEGCEYGKIMEEEKKKKKESWSSACSPTVVILQPHLFPTSNNIVFFYIYLEEYL